MLARQHVPYPFHITRSFALDPRLPELATLYLQSASGGLYRGDRLRLDIEAGRGAHVHLTSQAATVVHRTPDAPALLTTTVTVREHAFLALTNDPFILFPEASFVSSMDVTVAVGARVIVSDGFATHDPEARGCPFDRLETCVRILDADGRLIATERSNLSGRGFAGVSSPLGTYRAMGSILVLGPRLGEIDPHALTAEVEPLGCCAGMSELPNGGGLIIRCLTMTGGNLARAMDHLFAAAFIALMGERPARRPK
ncbi:urease accessory protein UreD [Xanthobacter aminoxidans]|uniref:urease accessory protein UreD n=1 Tax=Xanthobacter aminoxidans TaxID=186280 RepID=UPI002022BE72|nr:urease accessory protein UreD [Xanthobacter aminoxidans]